MQRLRDILYGVLLLSAGVSQVVEGHSVVVENSFGERIEVGVDEKDRFVDVLDLIQSYFDSDQLASSHENHFQKEWHLNISYAGLTARAKQEKKREYQRSVTREEKKSLHYIITTLGFESIFTIGKERKSLKQMGETIDHLHPYRFLMTIFTDEKLKAAAHAIRDRVSWVADGFFDGIIGSLEEEANRGNLYQFTEDFARKVTIDLSLIEPSLKNRKWKEFVNILIDNIPRQNDPNRYNM